MKKVCLFIFSVLVLQVGKAQQSEFVQWGAVGATINQPVIDIHATFDMSMFLMEDSTIRMAGLDCTGELRNYLESLEKVVYITTKAAITSDGVAHLFFGAGLYSSIADVKKVVQIESYFLLLMNNSNVLKSTAKGEIENLNLTNVKDIFSGGAIGGVIYEDGTAQFLDNIDGFQLPQEINENIEDIVLGAIVDLKILIRREDSTLIGYDNNQVVSFPNTIKVQSITCDNEAGFAYVRTDGTCGIWGVSYFNDLSGIENLIDIEKISLAFIHTIALKNDGSIEALGDNLDGVIQFNPDLTTIKDLSYGEEHNLAVKSDGSVIAWGGTNSEGELNVPSGLTNVKEVAAVYHSSIALKEDGSIVIWGDTSESAISFLQELKNLNNISQILVDSYGSIDFQGSFVALLSDGRVWKSNNSGLTGFLDFVPPLIDLDVNSGVDYIGLTEDRQVVTWQDGVNSPINVSDLDQVIDVGVHDMGFLALRANGKIVQWGVDIVPVVSTWENVVSIDVNTGVAIAALHADGSISAYSSYDPCYSRPPVSITRDFSVSRVRAFSDERYGAFVIRKQRFIKGVVYNDKNQNCIKDEGEEPIQGVALSLNSRDWFTLSDKDGYYSIPVDTSTNNYVVNVIVNEQFEALCGTSFNINLASGLEDYNLNISGQKKECVLLYTSVSGQGKRRCFPSKTVIAYGNAGDLSSGPTTLEIEYPSYLTPLSSNPAWKSFENGLLIYEFSTLEAGSSNKITVVDSVVCGNEAILGLAQCIKSRIGPSEYCAAISSEWDQVELDLTKECKDGVVNYKVVNNTTFDMSDSTEVRISINDTLVRKSRVKLKAFTDSQIDVNAFGNLVNIEVGQTIGFPEDSILTDFVEGCIASTQTLDDVVKGLALNKPFVPETSKETKSCFTITGSYDPNDKQALPIGLTDAHYVRAGTSIDYTIRFQNTGTDTAFKVVLVDTLDSSLDISTFMQGASSHPYSLKVSGKGNPILTFTFNNILLPDSNVNVLASNGFVSFKINTFSNLSDETIIENEAAIYFDYNSPVITNKVYHTIGEPKWEDFSRGNLVKINNPIPVGVSNAIGSSTSMIYPNPTSGFITVSGASEGDVLDIKSVFGQSVYQVTVDEKMTLSTEEFAKGIYFYQIQRDGKVIDTGKLIRQ